MELEDLYRQYGWANESRRRDCLLFVEGPNCNSSILEWDA